jgi:hypothetical protein
MFHRYLGYPFSYKSRRRARSPFIYLHKGRFDAMLTLAIEIQYPLETLN